MMNVTAELVSEHEVILTMLGVMEEIAEKLEKGQNVDMNDIDQSIKFVKDYVDRCHHGKEENLLFPAMEEAGIPKEGGPLGVMSDEHNLGRSFIQSLQEAFSRYQRGEEAAARDIVTNIRGYVDLLSHHIAKENQILFQMAEQVLSNATKERLDYPFKKVQHSSIGEEKYQAFRSLAEDLADKYLYSKV